MPRNTTKETKSQLSRGKRGPADQRTDPMWSVPLQTFDPVDLEADYPPEPPVQFAPPSSELTSEEAEHQRRRRRRFAEIIVEEARAGKELPWLLDYIKHLLAAVSPEQQCQLGEFIAREFERSAGQPAAFVTFSTFFSEFTGVRGASKQLKRSRPAVTTYVLDGVLPAIRLDKQYIFFKKHVRDFKPPGRGRKVKQP